MRKVYNIILKSESSINKEMKDRVKNMKPGDSKDGFIEVGKGTFVYKKIPYILRLLRYFNDQKIFLPVHHNKVSNTHCVVEYPKSTEKIVEILENISTNNSEFLYYDTLHIWNDKQNIAEQIAACHSYARTDIDKLFSHIFFDDIDKQIVELVNLKKELRDAIKGVTHAKV